MYYVRSKKLLKAAKDQSCVRCGADDGTIVGCHYTGLRQHIYGKGRGIKCHDLCVADLCSECHVFFDQPTERKSIESSEDFQHCIILTMVRRFEQGVLSD